ncbi:hypothetical protein A2U01_0077059, partial [Trifolium medium]|nr:hypothetical protein [Trifolium medium]
VLVKSSTGYDHCSSKVLPLVQGGRRISILHVLGNDKIFWSPVFSDGASSTVLVSAASGRGVPAF